MGSYFFLEKGAILKSSYSMQGGGKPQRGRDHFFRGVGGELTPLDAMS